jgi:hypothetical protein
MDQMEYRIADVLHAAYCPLSGKIRLVMQPTICPVLRTELKPVITTPCPQPRELEKPSMVSGYLTTGARLKRAFGLLYRALHNP